MPTDSDFIREMVEEIDSSERRPVKCRDCGTVADGQELEELFEGDMGSVWVCRACR